MREKRTEVATHPVLDRRDARGAHLAGAFQEFVGQLAGRRAAVDGGLSLRVVTLRGGHGSARCCRQGEHPTADDADVELAVQHLGRGGDGSLFLFVELLLRYIGSLEGDERLTIEALHSTGALPTTLGDAFVVYIRQAMARLAELPERQLQARALLQQVAALGVSQLQRRLLDALLQQSGATSDAPEVDALLKADVARIEAERREPFPEGG